LEHFLKGEDKWLMITSRKKIDQVKAPVKIYSGALTS
jgi:hypothetical protein